jgi:hypothetical protein
MGIKGYQCPICFMTGCVINIGVDFNFNHMRYCFACKKYIYMSIIPGHEATQNDMDNFHPVIGWKSIDNISEDIREKNGGL